MNERLREELQRYTAISAYLFLAFCALLVLRWELMGRSESVHLPLGLAAGKALILGKFILIGEAARIGTRIRTRTLLQLIAIRSVLLLLLLVVLSFLEEIIVGKVHGRSVAEVVAEFGPRSTEITARCIVLLMLLLPFVTMTEMDRVLGRGTLLRLLQGPAQPGK
jgi:D-alanyl-lipoteichoic acid acyltransferase DltB (MBOAT superfamily)